MNKLKRYGYVDAIVWFGDDKFIWTDSNHIPTFRCAFRIIAPFKRRSFVPLASINRPSAPSCSSAKCNGTRWSDRKISFSAPRPIRRTSHPLMSSFRPMLPFRLRVSVVIDTCIIAVSPIIEDREDMNNKRDQQSYCHRYVDPQPYVHKRF